MTVKRPQGVPWSRGSSGTKGQVGVNGTGFGAHQAGVALWLLRKVASLQSSFPSCLGSFSPAPSPDRTETHNLASKVGAVLKRVEEQGRQMDSMANLCKILNGGPVLWRIVVDRLKPS